MNDQLRIEGGVAVITGAASGIGNGLARQAAALNMRLVLADINAQQLDQVAASLDAEVLAVPTDVTDPAAMNALAAAAWERFGQVDLLFNNAGVLTSGFSWEISSARWEREFAVNVHGVLNGLRSFVPRLLEADRPAHIINTASVGGFLSSPLLAPYSATKFAVVALTEALYGELKLLNAPIGVSLLAPGPVHSGIFGDPFGEIAPQPATQQFVETLRAMLSEHGLQPDEFAERVFSGIRQNLFWLLPQPETIDAQLQQRVEDILARRNPKPLAG